MRLSLNTQIVIGSLAGIAFGLLLATMQTTAGTFVEHSLTLCSIVGKLFISLLKMILIPLVFTSIAVGIANLRAHAQMQKVWRLALLYYISTTMLAVLLGLIVVNIFKPGLGLEIDMFREAMGQFNLQQMTPFEFIENFLANLFMNPMASMAQGQILPTIMFALFLGVGLVIMGDRAQTILKFFNEFFELIMLMVNWIMKLLPIGIFCLLTKLVATQEVALLSALGKFIVVVVGATLFHGFVTLPLLLKAFTNNKLGRYYSGIKQALITALSTSSSAATLPVTYKCLE